MAKQKLTLKQKRFIEAYLETGNLTEAARRAGYSGNEDVLANIGYQNFRKLEIRRRIEARIADSQVSADEVIGTLAAQMRADATELFNDAGGFDIETLRQRGLGHLVKKVKVRREIDGRGEDAIPVDVIEIELHSSQSAAVQLSKILGIEQQPRENDADKRKRLTIKMLRNLIAQGASKQQAKSDLLKMSVRKEDVDAALAQIESNESETV